MSSSFGTDLRITIFGQSHSTAIGVIIEGLAAGEKIDMEQLQIFMNRRAPGKNSYSTTRVETDIPEFLSGLKNNYTCGTPIAVLIRNKNIRSSDYNIFAEVPRPAHADFTMQMKFGGYQDFVGGGHFSGRLTAPLCVAGGICMQILARHKISIFSRIASIGEIEDKKPLTVSTAQKKFPVIDDEIGKQMLDCIVAARNDGDSVGGIIECNVFGLQAGLGDPIFDGMENRIAKIIFGIPAVKGIEFGDGFKLAKMRGSQVNDQFTVQNKKIVTKTNHCGGILGGITNGMPLNFKVAIKPTPSIVRDQESINLKTLKPTKINIYGRHDPCIVPRAVPCVESATAIAIYDAFLSAKKYLDLE